MFILIFVPIRGYVLSSSDSNIAYCAIFYRWALAGHCDGIKYINITDARRSTAFDQRNSNAKLICDRHVIKDGSWYRFTSNVGGELATTPQKIYSCGTFHPIWMNGSHPTVEEGRANRTACMNTIHVPTDSCDVSFTITVLNCTGYYIYKLREPKACNEAYCAGNIFCSYILYG